MDTDTKRPHISLPLTSDHLSDHIADVVSSTSDQINTSA